MPQLVQKISAEQFPFPEPKISGFMVISSTFDYGPYFKTGNLQGFLLDLSQVETITDTSNPFNFGYKSKTPYIEYRF